MIGEDGHHDHEEPRTRRLSFYKQQEEQVKLLVASTVAKVLDAHSRERDADERLETGKRKEQ